MFLLEHVESKCTEFLESGDGDVSGSQGGSSSGVMGHPNNSNIEETESERKKILEEINKMQEKLAKLGPAPSNEQQTNICAQEQQIKSNLNIFKREFN